jgi:hypothetical protein
MGEVLTIERVRCETRALSPARAELRVTVTAGPESARSRSMLELRGRLVGPRCRYSQTVEVAYPLRPVPADSPGEMAARVVIPEPCLWDPESPFFYGGLVELLADGRPVDLQTLWVGFRELRLGPKGVRCNGRPVVLTGETRDGRGRARPGDELRRRGVNLLLVRPDTWAEGLWSTADETGCLMVYELSDGENSRRLAVELAQHPCGLGCLVPPELANGPSVAELMRAVTAEGGQLPMGLELRDPPAGPLPEWARFVVGSAEALAGVVGEPVLRLVRMAEAGS